MHKVVIVSDPGIDGAYAVALALFDPAMDVLALAATAGNVSADQATTNVHVLVEHFDPPKWPRIGSALPVDFGRDAMDLHGPGGLGGVAAQCAQLHHPHPADKLLADLVHQYPDEVTLLVLGPLTTVARAIDRDASLARHVKHAVIVGGAWHEPGNAGPVSEFHFACDPQAARQVARSGMSLTVLPLDVTRRAIFSPRELVDIPGTSRAGSFLGKIVPFGVSATAQNFGIEGFHLKDVLGVAFLAVPEAFKTRPMVMDVETQGELTRGMSVFDQRPQRGDANCYVATEVDMRPVRSYLERIFTAANE